MARDNTGLGAQASTLLRPTAPAAPAAPAELRDVPSTPDDVEAEGRGEGAPETQTAPGPRRRTPRRPAPTVKGKPRNLHLTDDVHDRLWQYARQKKLSVSAVANDLLEKALPRYEVKRLP